MKTLTISVLLICLISINSLLAMEIPSKSNHCDGSPCFSGGAESEETPLTKAELNDALISTVVGLAMILILIGLSS